ncbi:UDP-4-amino-4,6-dideoxy-N-acetyl-beta-L-altrosamine transaminase [Pseudomonas sp. NPDC007930]|uniref:UDP-4-amino-4, 6-dideoxy-N-acetyl-beta-L-altrosamine transaminase n=1 Tax=Pseudomonas sp. NPDC007930 TaxID=3364417 RepID=UPI0036E9548C
MIPYGRQNLNEADIDAVVQVLRSDWLTQGPAVERFEQALAAYCGSAHAVMVCNATAALHLACLAVGLGPGDRLWTSPNTFVASANCGLYCGAEVDFVDIDPGTLNLCADALAEKLAAAERVGQLPKVVVAVAFGGQSCDMRRLAQLARQYRFTLIEDASHAVGARYAGQPVGQGGFADITVFSFHPVKIITTGEGGMLLTGRADLAERLRRLRSHGITRDPTQMHGGSDGPWYYQQVELGFNYRATDLQAALGASQLSRLDLFVAQRSALASRYGQRLAGLPLAGQQPQAEARSAWHLYVVRVAAEQRRAVFEHLRGAGIGVNVHYIPVHLQPFYRRLGFAEGQFPAAEHYYREAISLPLYAGLSEAEQDQVIDQLATALARVGG